MTDERLSSVSLRLRGKPAMRGWHTGRARVIQDIPDLAQVEAGEVVVLDGLIAAGPVLEVAGAVIAEDGGVLSSLATLARERGIPCVVGVPRATQAIRDGDELVVDATLGTISVVTAAVCA